MDLRHDIAAGVDLLIHDSQYTDAEYGERVGWGHSSLPQAVALARSAGARRLVMFHHDPSHGDALLDSMAGEAREAAPDGPEIDVGREGATYDLPA